MKQIACPECNGQNLRHYTDAYVLRVPMLGENGEITLLDEQTNEFDDSFYECIDCDYRLREEELDVEIFS